MVGQDIFVVIRDETDYDGDREVVAAFVDEGWANDYIARYVLNDTNRLTKWKPLYSIEKTTFFSNYGEA